MINVDVIKEISKKSQQTNEKESKIVTQVKLLLESNAADEKDVLAKSGLNHHVQVAESITGEAIEKRAFYEKYGSFLSEADVLSLCLKYYLRCLRVDYFKGNIGPNVGADIKRFVEKHGLEADLNAGNFKKSLYIIAPAGSFKLEEKPKDPVLCYNPNEYNGLPHIFIPISKWGEDFTIVRRLYGLFNSMVLRTHLIISLLSMLIGFFFENTIFAGIISYLSLSIIVHFVCILNEGFDDYLEGIKDDYIMNPFDNFKRR